MVIPISMKFCVCSNHLQSPVIFKVKGQSSMSQEPKTSNQLAQWMFFMTAIMIHNRPIVRYQHIGQPASASALSVHP